MDLVTTAWRVQARTPAAGLGAAGTPTARPPRVRLSPFVAGALLLAATAQAAAQEAVLTGRLSNVFGNFLVGAGIVNDSGSFSELLSTPDLAYAREAADAGSVSGVVSGQPVTGSAGFASAAEYVFDGLQIVADGLAATTGETPFSYVSLGANAISSVRLDFRVPVLTNFVLTGTVLAVQGPDIGTRPSSAMASVQFNGAVGANWHTDSFQGDFVASGTLIPGTYRITGRASTELNGDAQYRFDLQLSPVPEPAAWMLLAMGMPFLLRSRRRTGELAHHWRQP